MVLVYLKNLLLPSQKPSRHETPPLLPTTDLPQTLRHQHPRHPPPDTPPCPRRPSQKPLPPSTSASATTTTTSSSSSTSTTATTTPSKKPYIDPRVLSDLTIGLSDGLTVPFALTAGLSAFNDTTVVLYGGLAELIAGSISMGLGGWLAGRGEAAFHANTLAATRALVRASPEAVRPLLAGVFRPYGVSESALGGAVVEELLAGEEELLVAFVMQFHHNLAAVEEVGRTPVSSAATIAAGYFFGGFVPLVPYVFVGRGDVLVGLRWSVIVMVVCLFVFGGGKTVLVDAAEEGRKKHWGSIVRGGIEMVLVGGVAAAAAMGIVRALGGLS